jgi:hypothetical protein
MTGSRPAIFDSALTPAMSSWLCSRDPGWGDSRWIGNRCAAEAPSHSAAGIHTGWPGQSA